MKSSVAFSLEYQTTSRHQTLEHTLRLIKMKPQQTSALYLKANKTLKHLTATPMKVDTN
jgi:hypothetical protein